MKNKLLRLIKMASYYLFIGICIQVFFINLIFADNSLAQRPKSVEAVFLDVDLENTNLQQTFKIIEEQTAFYFTYDWSDLNQDVRVNLSAKQVSLKEVLLVISRLGALSFRQINYNLDVRKIEKGHNVKDDKRIITIREDISISGKVTSEEDGEGLPGVNVILKGTTEGTVTDVNGIYKIDVPDENAVLVFSAVGFISEEVTVGTRNVVNIILVPDITSLEEVVVIGYGSVKKRDLTGSVGSISAGEVTAVPVVSPDQAIQGRVAGVQVTQAAAAPGGGITVRIRGSNSINAGNEPLYVIDGFPVYSENNQSTLRNRASRITPNALASINPNDIESIEVLKDASATAIYGARGANGVVLITTKRGSRGNNQISVNSYVGVQQTRNQYDLLNGSQFAALANEAVQNIPDPLSPLYQVPSTVNTDWQDEVFRTGIIQNHSISLTGGDQTTNYLVSGEYFKEEGVITGSQFERFSVRFNLDKKIGERLKIGNSIAVSRTANDIRDILATTLRALPLLPVFDQDGNYFLNTEPALTLGIGSRIDNPLAVAKEETNEALTTRALGNLYGSYEFIEGLTGKVMIGADMIYNKANGFQPQNTIAGLDLGGSASQSTVENISWLNENTLTYIKSFGEIHNINAVIGHSVQRQNIEAYGLTRTEFATDATSYRDISAGAQDQNISSRASQFTINSFFGRINYTLNDRYLFTFTGRADGSSKFGRGRKYGFFPSGAFAWRLGDTPFIKDLDVFSDLKFRASYGITGNQEIPPYRSLARLGAGRVIIGEEAVTSFNPSNELPNPELGWEQTSQLDIGLDMSFFQNRLSLTVDYYRKRTNDLLFRLQVPQNSGFSFIWDNIGEIENKGFEFSLNSSNLTGALKWNTSANLSINDNQVIDLSGDDTELLATLFQNTTSQVGNIIIVREGSPVTSFYTYRFDGIWQTQEEIDAAGTMPNALPGDERYVDLNGDGAVDGEDRTITGNGTPRILYGISNDFSYKNFELNVFFQGVADADILNLTRQGLEQFSGDGNVAVSALNRWQGPGTSNEIPRATSGGSPGPLLSDKYVEKGSFLRLRTLTLAYNLPTTSLGWNWIKKARIYLTGQNLLTITDYSGIDPEVNAGGQDQLLQGFDQWSYPMPKRYIVGVNFTF
ncbi:TonB-dependent receptor [Fulvivirgaceae bacterium BMA12]|uniref:TonB-dependent receptor n=1 Tax=Agaribacillus aureus TaxID=3051825 RepID=A0ABT8L659_9BACT|nr:TonB-dependent receptor [Fulvivirgaceae bacterium BMA12]